ncbi:aminotransferase class IV [Candidatus Sulfidibacterium hydrothermale]|uniref:aminotransferase class IV n=1 Tax=Candidatus Sulfidibacterium hydrothermale TaxID=2875962 RepID=UPI001F0B68B8|nr:aminotransferase class IV [Candidatus Sulfidibacterium hydrothermale]UBM61568.1 aminotransferase class IV [Candidatus Sulfidibacterium hydrothermale]
METALLNYFIVDTQLRSTCDFNPFFLEKGKSIYEVLRVENGIPVFLAEHIDRFFSSAQLEQVNTGLTPDFIRKAIRLLITENRMQTGNIKFLSHQNDAGDNRFMAWVMPFFYPSSAQYREGVTVGTMAGERHNPNAKKALYALRQKADRMIKEKGWYEVVYVNRKKIITEGSRSNIFFIKQNQLVTPELSLVLPGITRSKVIMLARQNNIELDEREIRREETGHFDACFLTGTSPKVLPVRRFDDTAFDVSHPVIQYIMKAYDRCVEEDIRKFRW